MRRKNALLAALAVLLAVLVATAACSGQQTPQAAAQVRPSRTPRPTFTATVEVPTPVVPTATEVPPTQAPTATTQPSPTPVPPTPTPLPPAEMTAKQSINVRRGPGTNYPVVGKIEAGAKAEVIGRNDGGNWYQFNFEGEPGWVAAELVDLSGNVDGIEVAQNIPAPPVATATRPRPTAAPRPRAAPTSPPPPPAPSFPFQLTTQGTCSPNAGTAYVDGVVRHRDNSLYNGVCVHIAFYGPRNTKCSGCDGAGDGNWSFSPFGGPAPAGTTVEVFVVACPGPLPLGGQTQDTGFGSLTPVSDKWIHTFSQSEECHGVTFVGD